MYQRIKSDLFEITEKYLICEKTFDHFIEQIGGRFPEQNTEFEKLPGATPEAINIWYARLFSNEIGCHESIFDYLINFEWPAEEISATLRSLRRIGANELYIRLHDGIFHSRFENAQFWNDENTFGLEDILEVEKYSNFSEIDSGMNALNNELDEIITNYILSNKEFI